MILACVIVGLLGLTILGMVFTANTYTTPWCSEERGQFRCHLPKGHLGEHRCDDFTGDFCWASDD